MLIKYFSILIILIPIFLTGQSVSVSVTNNNIALVKETRHLDLKEGQNIIEITDVPAQLEPTSVFIDATDQDFPVTRKDASQIEFVLPVPANSSKTITFEILFSW